jgi:hypothetical protein
MNARPDAPVWARCVGVRLCQVLLAGLGFVGSPATAQGPDKGAQAEAAGKVTAYDIPSQSLAAALDKFSATSGIELFYESSLVVGQRSSPVHGEYFADTALREILKGTGFSGISFDRGTITIVGSAGQASPLKLAAIKARVMRFLPYLATVQDSLRVAFCSRADTRTDTTDIIARLWIGPTGAIQRAELVSSTGSGERDRSYSNVLRNLAVGSPPADMPQPVTLIVLPRNSVGSAGCAEGGVPSRSSTHE